MRERIIKIIGLLLISTALLNLQVWIVRTLFPNAKEKTRIFRYTLLMGGLATGIILVYTYLVQPRMYSFTTNESSNLRYSIFVAIAGLLIALVFAKQKKRWRVFAISTITIISVITGGVEWLLAGSAIGLLILKATSEEVLKTSASQALSSHTQLFSSDVILMSILAGFGFALFENIVYFVQGGTIGGFFLRSLTTSLLHAIFTGVIGFVLWKSTKLSIFSYIIAYFAGICLHIFYNYTMSVTPVLGGIVFIIGGYFLLTYLLYKTDRVYLE